MNDRRNLLQESLAAIERLQARLDASERARNEPIAIVGASCRYPGGSDTPDSLWRVLRDGVDAVCEVPPDRWDSKAYYDPDPKAPGKMMTRWGGFISGIDQFDPQFFGISPREAATMDPQQRLLLETAYEALESSGIAVDSLTGSRTGVFVGITTSDYGQRMRGAGPEHSDVYSATGNALNAAAGRISFAFGFQGPCVALDTACSSSLVAVHLACQGLRTRECNLALAGGVNIVLSPDAMVLFSKWGMMAADGRCKTFDAAADGFVRGEGCAVVALKRLSDAIADGDPILAVIRGSAVNSDGRSSGLTVPNGPAQQAVVQSALASSGLKPSDIDYVEAHGTGTPLGDPIEVEALGAVLCAGRPAERPLLIGSVKTNLGHTEAASGLAGLLKVVLSLRHEAIPPHLHFSQPNPGIAWESMSIGVPTALTPWVRGTRPRRAGVSSFGFSGTNAHVILEEAPLLESSSAAAMPGLVNVLTLSGKSAGAVRELAGRYAAFLESHPEVAFADVCRTSALGRTPFSYRVGIAADSSARAAQLLAAVSKGESPSEVAQGRVVGGARARVAFMFPGQGSQWAGMARQLHESEPVFREAFDACAPAFAAATGMSLLDLLGREDLLGETQYTQPALFAVEWALSKLWMSYGVSPCAVIGHSVGEYVAACVAGVMDVQDGVKLIAARGRLMQARTQRGAMLAILGDESLVSPLIAGKEAQLSIAAINAPDSIVVSGATDAIEALQSTLQARSIRVQRLAVSHGFHSPLMDPMLKEFAAVAATIQYRKPSLPLISNVTGRVAGAEVATPDYWVRHVRQPVLFARGIAEACGAGASVMLEVGPGTTLLGLGKRCIKDESLRWVRSLQRDRNEQVVFAEAVAQLWSAGVAIDWGQYHQRRGGKRVGLPTYAFQRERHWIEANTRPVRATRAGQHPLLGGRVPTAGREIIFESVLSDRSPAWLQDHKVFDGVVVPGTGYLELAAAAAAATGSAARPVEGVSIEQMLEIPAGAEVTVQLVMTPAPSGETAFEIFSRASEDAEWLVHARGRIGGDRSATTVAADLATLRAACSAPVDVPAYYDTLSQSGVSYGPGFRGIQQLWRGAGQALGLVVLPDLGETAAYRIHPALLDACFQTCGAAIEAADDAEPLVYVPVGLEKLDVHVPGATRVWAHAAVRQPFKYGAETLFADISLLSEAGERVALVSGLACKRISRASLQRGGAARDWLYELQWMAAPRPASVAAPARESWLVLSDDAGIGGALAEQLKARGEDCTIVPCSEELDFDRLIDSAATRVVHLGSLAQTDEALSADTLGAAHRQGCASLLGLVQALGRKRSANPPQLTVVTRGVAAVAGRATRAGLAAAPIAGLTRVVALEHPQLRCRAIDLDASRPDAAELLEELLQPDRENQVAFHAGTRYAARLVRSSSSRGVTAGAETPVRLDVTQRGALDQLVLTNVVQPQPGANEVVIRVRAAGLNFRDVLNALGMYPGDPGALGNECAGTVVAVGAGVSGYVVGDDVMALASGCFGTYVVASTDLLIHKPARLTFEDSATIPIAFLTAVHGFDLAQLAKGERVLIHAAAGGVGLAAVGLAMQKGAEVYATAGSPRKREFLKSLGVKHVFDSRTLDFASQIAEATGGKGVDVVLNSLNGEFIGRSVACLARNGRFIEIGKRDVWDAARMSATRADVGYHVFDLGDVLRDDRPRIRQMMLDLSAHLDAGRLAPLPSVTFTLDEAPAAFRYMAQAKHIGKVVVTPPAPPIARNETPITPEGTYLITGGLGGLGLLVAQRFVDAGARSLVLLGRREPTAQAREVIARLVAAGARVQVAAVDVSNRAQLQTLLDSIAGNLPPLKGVVHAAGVLDDGVLTQQDWTRFERVLSPKVNGGWHLHSLTQQLPLDFFVLFSSASALIGSPGQGNYTAANAFLDALARFRRANGLPALSIAWGAWADSGMAAGRSSTQLERSSRHGVRLMSADAALDVLADLLHGSPPHVGVLNMDWREVLAQFPAGSWPPVLDQLAQAYARETPAGATESSSLPDRLASASGAGITQVVVEYVRECAALVLGLRPEQLDLDRPLVQLGLDSLMGVELRNRIERGGAPSLPLASYLSGSDVQQLAHELLSQIAPAEAAAGAAAQTADNDLLERLPEMSEAELDAHLERLMKEGAAL